MNENTISIFDRTMGMLHDLPDTVKTKPSTVQVVLPIIGVSQAWIVQTLRHREQGDTIFVQSVSAEGQIRIAIPPAVAEAIHRQYDALGAKSRSKAAKAVAADRKARGIQPGFLRKRRPRGKESGTS